MKILAIETSCNIASASILDDNNLILELKEKALKNHSETLMPLIDKTLKNSNISLSDIDLFAVDNGPGSFTGIRIGLSTVKAFCDALSKPCISVSSLEALAYTSGQEDSYICSMIDAKHSNVYYSIFEKKENNYIKINNFKFDTIDNLLSVLGSLKKKIFFVGNCGILYKDMIKSYLKNDIVFEEDDYISSKYVGLVAFDKFKKGESLSSDELTALYLKKTNAEESLVAKT